MQSTEVTNLSFLDNDVLIKNVKKPYVIITLKQYVDRKIELDYLNYDFEAVQNSTNMINSRAESMFGDERHMMHS